jgi:hypothetical protein
MGNRSKRGRWTVSWVLLVAALFGGSALWAEPVQFTAEDETGRPVEGAKFEIRDLPSVPGATVITDEQGRAETQLPPGTYTAAVEQPDSHSFEVVFTVVADQPTVVTARLTRLPPFSYASLFNTGVGTSVASSADLEAISLFDFVTNNGVRGSNRAETPTEHNRTTDDELDLTTYAFDFAIGLSGLVGGDAAAKASFARAPLALLQSTAAGAGGGGEPGHFQPVLTLTVGRADVEFAQVDLEDASRTVRYEGDGLLYGAGFAGLWSLCDDCPWFAAGEVGHARTEGIDVDRRPGPSTNGQITGQSYEFEYAESRLQASLIRAFRDVALWVGARGVRREAELDAAVTVDFSALAGMPFVSRFDFGSEHEDETVEAMIGLDFRFPRTRLFGRLMASSDGDNETVLARLTYGFGL